MLKCKVLILTSSTGGGHISAAESIKAALEIIDSNSIVTEVVRVLEDSSFITKELAEFYNFLLRSYQPYVKYYHWFINMFNPDSWGVFYTLTRKYWLNLISTSKPDIIVSVHPMIQYVVGRVLSELKLSKKVPFVAVMTDPCGNSWKGWCNSCVDSYFVPSDQAKQELVAGKIKEELIEVLGMPIHPKFQNAEHNSISVLRNELGLDADTFTVFMNAGWIGGGNIPAIYDVLIQANLKIQIIFLAGRNTKLEERAVFLAKKASFPITVVGYTNSIDRLMKASDVMVSKLGGLTTFEALSVGLPIIADAITPPMPQEAGIVDWLELHKAAIILRRPEDVASVLSKLIVSKNTQTCMRKAALILAKPDAAILIAQRILNLALLSKNI